jgi:hypothetical protein
MPRPSIPALVCATSSDDGVTTRAETSENQLDCAVRDVSVLYGRDARMSEINVTIRVASDHIGEGSNEFHIT